MKEKMNKKTLISLIIVGIFALITLAGLLVWNQYQQRVVDGTVQEETEDAPILVLDYNNVSLGLDHSFTVHAKTYWRGEEVKDEIEYTWELDEEYSPDIASMEAENDSAKITGLAYGETGFKVSAEYKGTILVKTLQVHVGNIDVIFDSSNMKLSAGCYTVDLWLLETETNRTSITPEIHVYDKEELVKKPVFEWENSDESIAVREKNGTITAKKAGSTLIVGTYKESELHIRVNVHRTKLEKDPVCIEQVKNYALSFSELRGTEVEDVRFNGVSVLKDYNKGSGTIKFDPDKLPEIGAVGELLVQTEKSEMVMEAIVVTMGIYKESDLNRMASVIKANKGAGYYALARDIKCSGTYDAKLDVEFVGTFDGRGNAIYNMTTSDRDGSNRGLVGTSLGSTGTVKNVSFVNAKHSGNGGFIATNASGTIKDVYIQIDMEYSEAKVASVLSTYTYGVFSTEHVLVEYMNPLPTNATNGYALGQLYHGYANHQGLYIIGTDKIASQVEDLGGGLKDEFAAYMSYGDYLNAGADASKWKNDFWGIQNGIPYPAKLGTRTGTMPDVSIPKYTSPGTTVTIQGATIYDRITVGSSLKKLGIKVSGPQLIIPEKVPVGTVITLQVSSVFDATKKTTITTKVLETEKIKLSKIYNAETYKQKTFAINLGSYASKVVGAKLFHVTVDGKPFAKKVYKNGILTLDNKSAEGFGRKTVEVIFKKGEKLIAFTIPIDVCTMAIYDETGLKNMAGMIAKNKGAGRYVLGGDIVCTGTYDSNLGVAFTGSFDGHGYIIYNMTTSDRDAGNRGLLGASLADTGVVENVSFVNAKHGGKGAFIATSASGTIRNVYIQMNVTGYNSFGYDNATSILASSTYGVFSTENVVIEYVNPLPKNATNGYAVWQLWHGYGKHQGLYVVGANAVSVQEEDLGGGLPDKYEAYMSYADFADADVTLDAWKNDFWGIYNGVPYPKRLSARIGKKPQVSIPQYVGAGGNVAIDGLTIYDRVVLGSNMKKLGIKVKNGALVIPKSVPRGTKVKATVQSVFDTSKKTMITTKILETEKIRLSKIYNAETYKKATFAIDLGAYASKVEGAKLFYAAADGKTFARMLYKNGTLTLDNESMEGFGRKTLEATFKKGNKLIAFTIPIDVCTMAIYDETDLKDMASIIAENKGAGRYVLGGDIVCTGTYDSNLGVAFTGIFDGHGYVIYNMTTSDRDAGNRGLLGASLADTGVVENVSFVNAKHGGKGAFIATSASGTIRNVYIQMNITGYNSFGYDDATSILASSTYGVFSTENVVIEYVNPLPKNATNGYAVWQLWNGYGKHQGLYVVGANAVSVQEEDLGGGRPDKYGAYMSYADFADADITLDAWKNDFWGIYNGVPYPKRLSTRVGKKPQVSIPKYAGAGGSVLIDGLTIYDRVVLGSDMKKLGIKVKNGALVIPKSVPRGTNIRVTVESVFDSSKKTGLQATVYDTINVTLNNAYDVEIYNHTTFDLDFGAQASEVNGGTLVSATIGNTNFAKATYHEGVLTLDTSTLAEDFGKKVVTVVFDKDKRLVTVTINIDVSTMVIRSEEDLNNMTATIIANNGMGRYVLGQDITCQGTYDSNSDVAFNGVFDGRGYAIYNMKTSDRDGGYRSLIGKLGASGVIENVSFVNAKHGGQGGFITTYAQGKIRNVYIRIDITDYNSFGWDGATSVLASSTAGTFSTENVLIEYINPLPSDATNGYAIWEQYYGYQFHKGLYVIGADRVNEHEKDLGAGLQDIYAAYRNYGDFVTAGNDLTTWANDFWAVTNGIPYPTHLGVREGKMPQVSIPTVVAPGSEVVIAGATMYDRVILAAGAKELGITVSNNVILVPETVPTGTTINLVVQSVFDDTKKVTLSTEILTSQNVSVEDVTIAEKNKTTTTFQVDLTQLAAEIGEATLVGASVDGTAFVDASYENGILTLDTVSLSGYGEKTVSATFKATGSLVSVTIPIDVCTMAIDSEEDLNNMTSVIEANGGKGRYILTADITCKGTYDSNSTVVFDGVFDGCGYTIYNMKTSNRDGGYRSLIGTLGASGVIENVSFVNAKHGGQGGFITTNGQGKIRNVYVQIDITDYTSFGWDGATSVLASSTAGVFSTENVLVEYIKPLPSDATTGYAIWEQYYGYQFHKGLYVIGADRVNEHEKDLSAGLQDIYAAYRNYDDFTSAENDLSGWENNFWTVKNGIPYPTKLGAREAVVPTVTIPEVVEPGSNVAIEGVKVYERIVLDAEAQALGITVTGNVVNIPDSVALGTEVHLTVVSIFDTTKSTALTTTVNVQQDDEELTRITWTDFKLWEPLTFGTTFSSEACATYSGTNLNNTAFEGDVSIPAGSGFRYAVPSAWYGLTIKESSGKLLIGGDSYVALNGVNGTAYTLNAADYGLTTFTDKRFTIRIELYNLSSDNLSATLNIYVNGKIVGEGITLTGSTVAATTYLGSGIGFVQNGLAGGITIYDVKPALTPITWTDFKLWDPLTYETTFSSEAYATYSGSSLNNTAFEGDVVIPSGSGFRYAVPSAWYGLTIKESSGKLLIGGDTYVALNGVNGTAYTLNAENYGLTTFTNKRFTIRIELYNLSNDNLSANVNIYVNGKSVGEGLTLTGSTVAATTYLGSGIGFVQNGLAGGITIYDVKPALTPITWTDFKLWEPLTYETTFNSEACATYSGSSLNNTAFEGDVAIPSGSGFRYAVPSSWYGLTIKESSGKLLIGGDSYVALNGVNGTAYTLNAEDYGLTTFTNKRFTIRIELYNLSNDNLSANVNIYVNDKLVGEGLTLTGSTVAATTYLGGGIGFAQNGLAGGTTIYEAK